MAENADTSTRIKVADIVVSDDPQGTNDLALAGDDAALFEIDGSVLYLKAGVTLDFETTPTLNVAVTVDDTTVGTSPDDAASLIISLMDVPQLSGIEETILEYTENDPATWIAPFVTLGDLDSGSLSWAVVSLTTNYQGSEDELAATTTETDLEAEFDTVTGVLTISGLGTLLEYQQVLRSVTYRNKSENPSTVIRTASFRVNDGVLESNKVTRQIAVIVQNDGPIAEAGGPYTVSEGGTVILDASNSADPDDGIASYAWDLDGDGVFGETGDSAARGDETGPSPALSAVGMNGPSTVIVSLRVTDSVGLSDTDTATIQIENVAPALSLDGADSIDEGLSYTLTLGLVTDPGPDSISQYLIDWGDGHVDPIDANSLPSDRIVTHIYADGVPGGTRRTIWVSLVDNEGTYANVASKPVTVNDVPPTLSLGGEGSVNEGSSYVLTLKPIVDPGQHTVSHYQIAWGDGHVETIPVADPLSDRVVAHTYADGNADGTTYAIDVSLIDEDGVHARVASKDVIVNNVRPMLTLSGDDVAEVGQEYTLTIGAVTDPGSDTVERYTIYWGDGTQDTRTEAELADTGRQVTHIYAAGQSAQIVVDVKDDDGLHTQVATKSLVAFKFLYWDSDHTGPNDIATGTGLGGTGNWTSDNCWFDSATDSHTTWTNGDYTVAVLDGTGGTVTLSSSVTVDRVLFRSTGFTLNSSGGSITLSGTSSCISVEAGTATISAPIAGSNGLTKTGDGTLILSGGNTYSGGTTICDGILQLNNGGVLGAGDITNNASLVFSRTDNLTVASVISGTGNVVQQGTGTLTLTGNNTYSGTTTISTGTLQVGNFGTTSTGTLGTGDVVNEASLVFYRRGTVTVPNAISGENGTVTQQGYGKLILTGTNTYKGNTVIIPTEWSPCTIEIGDGGTLESRTVTSSGGYSSCAHLVFNCVDGLTVNNVIAGGGNVTIATGSILRVGNSSEACGLPNGTTGTGTVTVSGTLDLNGFSPTVGNLAGSGTVTSNGDNVSTLHVGGGNTDSTFPGVIEDGLVAVALTKVGTGTVTLTGTNTYSGRTTISTGTLQVGNFGTTSTGTLGTGDVVNEASLVFYRRGTVTVPNAISGENGTVTQQGYGKLILTGTNTYKGNTVIIPTEWSPCTIEIGDGGTLESRTVTSSGGYSSCAHLVFNCVDGLTVCSATSKVTVIQQGAGELTLTGDISDSASVIQQGAGVLTLTGNNTYTGTTTIDTGTTLEVGHTNALGTGTVTVNGRLDLHGYSVTLGGLKGSSSGLVTSSTTGPEASVVTVGGNGQTTTFSGVIENGSRTVALTKVGTGTLTLAGNNAYSGATTISAGALVLTGDNGQCGGAITILAGTLQVGNNTTTGAITLTGGTLLFKRQGTVNVPNVISGSGALTQQGYNGADTLVLTGDNTNYSGTVTISTGALQVGPSGTDHTLGSGSVVNNSSLVFNCATPVTVGNVISGSGSLTQQGTGALTLTRNNTYTGTTTIDTGTTLEVGHTNALGTGTVTVNGRLDLHGYSVTLGGLKGSSSGLVTSSTTGPEASVVTVGGNGQTTTFSGVIENGSRTVALTKVGTGTLTLAGNNAYSGATTISAGALVLTGDNGQCGGAITILAGTLQVGNNTTTGAITLTGGTLLFKRQGTVNVPNVISGSGALTQQGYNGADTLVLTGDNTNYSGTVTISTGALQVGPSGTDHTLGSGSVVNNSSLVFNCATPVTVGNVISGSGSLTQQGTGALTLTRNNTYTGTTTITGGTTLEVGDGGTTGTLGTGAVNGSGVGGQLVFNRGETTTIGNAISGSVSLVQQGSGILILAGSNSYTGDTTINAGRTVQLGRTNSLPSGSGKGNVIVNGTLDLYGFSVSVGGLRGTGVVTSAMPGDVTLNVGSNSQDCVFDGVIQKGAGTVALTKTGTGVLTLNNVNTYTGSTTVSQGTLSVGGSISSSAVTISGGTLSGTGLVGAVTASSGTLSPGMSGEGTLNTANLAFSTGSAFDVEVSDSGSDLVNVTGTVNLGNATLNVDNTRGNNDGDVVVLIRNDDSDLVIGTFMGLAEGAQLAASGLTYVITYTYNAETGELTGGNDVALIDASVPPLAPCGLTATPVSDRQIDLRWTDNSADETGFKIERSLDGSGWEVLATVGAGETIYSDYSLSEGMLRYYRVQATNAHGDSGYTNSCSARTRASSPTNLRLISICGSQVVLGWQDNSDSETRYCVEQRVSNGNWTQIWQSVGANSVTATIDLTFEPATLYSFRVLAYNSTSQYSEPSNIVQKSTDGWPSAPSGLTAMAVSDSQINLSWTASSGVVTGYRIEWSADGSTWGLLTTAASNQIAYSDSGLNDWTTRYYRVQAINSQGGSGYSSIRSARPLVGTPTGLTCTSISSKHVTLEWQDNSACESQYFIDQWIENEGWRNIGSTWASNNTTTIERTFAPSTQYRFQVRAYGYTGTYSQPSEAIVTTPAWPAAPSGLTATVVSNSQIDLSWTASPSGATKYEVEWSPNNSAWLLLASLDANVTTFSDRWLADEMLCYYRVRAANDAGASGYSNTVLAATSLIAPTELTLTSISCSQVVLEWQDNSLGENYYHIDQWVNDNWTRIKSVSSNSKTATIDGTFAPSTGYRFRVRAYRNAGDQYSQPSELLVTTPSWPTDLTATAVSDSQINLQWTASPGDPTPYELQWSANGYNW